MPQPRRSDRGFVNWTLQSLPGLIGLQSALVLRVLLRSQGCSIRVGITLWAQTLLRFALLCSRHSLSGSIMPTMVSDQLCDLECCVLPRIFTSVTTSKQCLLGPATDVASLCVDGLLDRAGVWVIAVL